MYIATIDAGTSNTRTRIWHEDLIVAESSQAVGVRNTAIDGNNSKLIAAIHDTLHEAAPQAGIAVNDMDLVLASGMLTSNVGLVEIPHVVAPVSLKMLADSMLSKTLPEICSQPIWFVPGVKNFANEALADELISEMDIMRGEEVEACALLKRLRIQGPAIMALPGSHNKYVAFDEDNKIVGCMTTIAGEMLHSLTFDTILADAVKRSFATEFDQEAFCRGVDYGEKLGLGRAAFMARIMTMFAEYTPSQAQNYLLGLILADDWQSLQGSPLFAKYQTATIVVAGKPVMQQAYKTLFEQVGRNVILVDDSVQCGLSGFGAIVVAKERGLV